MIEPEWFRAQIAAIEAGVVRAEGESEPVEEGEDAPKELYQIIGDTAVVNLAGPMMKIRSKFGGTSTVDARNAIRKAMTDARVSSIMLHIDSPGGTSAGTDALARDVAASTKPVHAHIEDMGASAAYYVASQASRITASPTSLVGSLGTRLTVIDSSAYFAKEGLKVHEIASGEFKGAGAEGVPVTDRQVAYFQGIVNDMTEHFKNAVMGGRKMDRATVDTLFDGRVHDAATAQKLGLIDEVSTLDAAMTALSERSYQMNLEQFNAFAAEHPEAVKTFEQKGFDAGLASAKQLEKTRLSALLEVYGKDRTALALSAFQKDQAPDQAKQIVEALDSETARLNAELTAAKAQAAKAQAEAGTQAAVGTKPASAEAPKPMNPAEQAAAEWAKMSEEDRAVWAGEDIFIAYRKKQIVKSAS